MVVQQLIRCFYGAFFAVIAAPALTLPNCVQADDAVKPVVVLSIASVDQLMGDFSFLTKVAGRAGCRRIFAADRLVRGAGL